MPRQPDRRRDFISTTHAKSYDFIFPTSLDLVGRHALVTGAALEDGVGYATAMAFARAGASAIVLVDLHKTPEKLLNKLTEAAKQAGRVEPNVVSCQCDITDEDEVHRMKQTISEALQGRLDVLVNNAAHMEPYGNILDADPAVEWRTWEVNIHGMLNMARTFLPLLFSTRKHHYGLCTMVNVSSSGALTARPGSANYRSSKLAILRWTESMQLDLDDRGLVAYCVNPGAIKTQITINEPEELRNKLPHQPEIAGDTIVWLASERREWLGGRYVSCP